MHQNAARRFQSHRDLVRRCTRALTDPVQCRVHRGRRMGHRALAADLPRGIHHTKFVLLTSQINPHKPPEHLRHSMSFPARPPVSCIALVLALAARLPTRCPHGPPRRGASLRLALEAQAASGTPDKMAELVANQRTARSLRLWKLPEPWTHTSRPPLLGNAENAFPQASTDITTLASV